MYKNPIATASAKESARLIENSHGNIDIPVHEKRKDEFSITICKDYIFNDNTLDSDIAEIKEEILSDREIEDTLVNNSSSIPIEINLALEKTLLNDNTSKYAFYCPRRTEPSQSYQSLRSHFFEQHIGSHWGLCFRCNICKVFFSSHRTLCMHKLDTHGIRTSVGEQEKSKKEKTEKKTENGRYPCATCGASFKAEANLKRHLTQLMHHDPRTLLYNCDKCPARYADRTLLKNHSRAHDGKHQWKVCPHCEVRICGPVSIRMHIQEHNLKYKCWHCDAMMPDNKRLRTHTLHYHADEVKQEKIDEDEDAQVDVVDPLNDVKVKVEPGY